MALLHEDYVAKLIQHYKHELDSPPLAGLFGKAQAASNVMSVAGRFAASAHILFDKLGMHDDDNKAAVIAAVLKFYETVLSPIIGTLIGHPLLFTVILNPLIEKLIPLGVSVVYNIIARIHNRSKTVESTADGFPAGFSPL